MKIRNKSNEALTIGLGFAGPRTVQPDETIDVPDAVADHYLFAVDGGKTIPSDLWVEAGPPKKAADPAS